MGSLSFPAPAVWALDKNGSGHVTSADLGGGLSLKGTDDSGKTVDLYFGPDRIGLAARIFEIGRAQVKAGNLGPIQIPESILAETPTARTLLACDAYASSQRAMGIPEILDTLLAHPDPKLGVFNGGLFDDGVARSYRVVVDGRLAERTATYDGKKIHLYLPASERDAIAALTAYQAGHPGYDAIEIHTIDRATLGTDQEKLALRYDRPGVFWASTTCPLLPELRDTQYIVPGARFGVELYYHDGRINLPGAKSTVTAKLAANDVVGAAEVLSLMRGTTNAYLSQIFGYGKAMNANLTVYAGRSQAPGLTTCIRETYEAWKAVAADDPASLADARIWLSWALDGAIEEYRNVWTSGPRYDAKTGLSRYLDELPSQAPEEVGHYYQGIEWRAADLESDGAIREHGWDIHPAAILLHGPDAGRPRQHQLLPVCLNSLLHRYEKDLALLLAEAGRESEAPAFAQSAQKRAATMERLMWNEVTGLYHDVHKSNDGRLRQNEHEDLRSYLPLWAGITAPGSSRAKRLIERIADFQRPGGLANATRESWDRVHRLNPEFTERCQWGHPDLGWPISVYETVEALLIAGADTKAHEIAYRWCHMVQSSMEKNGGLQLGQSGGYEGAVMEKMDTTRRSPEGVAEVGYGNQGAGHEGEGGGFRWGYDAYKLLARLLPKSLVGALERNADPDALFDPRFRQ